MTMFYLSTGEALHYCDEKSLAYPQFPQGLNSIRSHFISHYLNTFV